MAALRAEGIDVDWRELADVLWLAQKLPPVSAEEPGPSPPRPAAARPAPTSGASRHRSAEREVRAADDHEERPAPQTLRRGADADDRTGVPLELPPLPPEPHPAGRELGRALRGFDKRREAATGKQLDVIATVDRYCDSGVLAPVFVPVQQGWFHEVALVVDGTPTMAVWRDRIAGLATELERHHAFQRVVRWTLSAESGTVWLRSRAGTRYRPEELAAPARRLVLMVTDGVHALWRGPAIRSALRAWGAAAPMAIVHVLPPRLWGATALGDVDVGVTSGSRGAANSRFWVSAPWWWMAETAPRHAVPVVPFEAAGIARWARMLMAGDGVWLPAVLVEENAVTDVSPPITSPAEQVASFVATVSTEAARLAVLMSAIEVTLSSAKLVRAELVPEGSLTTVAELLVGGVLNRYPDDRYEFLPGVREVLQRKLTTTDVLAVWRVVAPHLERTSGRPAPFSRLLGLVDNADSDDLEDQISRIASGLIQRLGLRVGEVPMRSPRPRTPVAPRGQNFFVAVGPAREVRENSGMLRQLATSLIRDCRFVVWSQPAAEEIANTLLTATGGAIVVYLRNSDVPLSIRSALDGSAMPVLLIVDGGQPGEWPEARWVGVIERSRRAVEPWIASLLLRLMGRRGYWPGEDPITGSEFMDGLDYSEMSGSGIGWGFRGGVVPFLNNPAYVPPVVAESAPTMHEPALPMFVLRAASEVDVTLRGLARNGWTVRQGFALPNLSWDIRSARLVLYGSIADMETANLVVLAAARGAGVVALPATREITERLLADLSGFGPVQQVPEASVPSALNRDQRALLDRLADGDTIAAAAASEHISLRTANRRIAEARELLGARTTREAVLAHLRQQRPG